MAVQNSKSSHVLITLGVLFTVASAARLIPEGQALAEENTDKNPVSTKMETEVVSSSEYATETSDAKLGSDVSNTDVASDQVCFNGEMAAALSEDRWIFEQREAELVEQQLTLQEWEARLKKRTSELESLEVLLNERWTEMKTESDSDLKHLAQMYGSMKPDQASLIFNEMDTNFAAGFLRQLPSDQAGLILANMDTEKAYIVSVRLASMNDDIRTSTQ